MEEWIGPELRCPKCKKDVSPSPKFHQPKQFGGGMPISGRLARTEIRLTCPVCKTKLAAIKGFYPLGYRAL